MNELTTQLLAQERVREIRKRQREADHRRTWQTTPTRPNRQRRFPRR